MSAAETLYTVRTPYPDLLEMAREQVVSLPVYRNGALVAPTQAGSTVSIYKPDGTALVSAAAVVVTGSVATYTIPAASLPTTLTPLGEGWREEWALVMSGETTARNWRREAAFVRRSPYPTVTDADLTARYPDIVTQLGTAASSFQAMIDAAWGRILRQLLRNGHLVYLITSLDGLHDWLENEVLTDAYWSAYRGTNGASDKWLKLAERHEAKARAFSESSSFAVDANHDGRADSSSRTPAGTVIHPNAAPTNSYRPSRHW